MQACDLAGYSLAALHALELPPPPFTFVAVHSEAGAVQTSPALVENAAVASGARRRRDARSAEERLEQMEFALLFAPRTSDTRAAHVPHAHVARVTRAQDKRVPPFAPNHACCVPRFVACYASHPMMRPPLVPAVIVLAAPNRPLRAHFVHSPIVESAERCLSHAEKLTGMLAFTDPRATVLALPPALALVALCSALLMLISAVVSLVGGPAAAIFLGAPPTAATTPRACCHCGHLHCEPPAQLAQLAQLTVLSYV